MKGENYNRSKVLNVMRREHLTFTDLTTMTAHEFSRFRYIGAGSVEEARKLLAERGLAFKEEFLDHKPKTTAIEPIKVETIEVAGFASALQALRLPYSLEPRSFATSGATAIDHTLNINTNVSIHDKDLALLTRLVKNGDEHAKVLRGIVAYLKISAPIYWWCEMETYRIGHERLSSESTMHTDCKGLAGEVLQKAKGEISMGKRLTKVDMFSYQALRRICQQRELHRLPEWSQYIEAVRTLPFADFLIFA